MFFVLYLPQEPYYSQWAKVRVCHSIYNTDMLKEKNNVVYAGLDNQTSLTLSLADVGAEMISLCFKSQSLQH